MKNPKLMDEYLKIKAEFPEESLKLEKMRTQDRFETRDMYNDHIVKMGGAVDMNDSDIFDRFKSSFLRFYNSLRDRGLTIDSKSYEELKQEYKNRNLEYQLALNTLQTLESVKVRTADALREVKVLEVGYRIEYSKKLSDYEAMVASPDDKDPHYKQKRSDALISMERSKHKLDEAIKEVKRLENSQSSSNIDSQIYELKKNIPSLEEETKSLLKKVKALEIKFINDKKYVKGSVVNE